MDLTESGLERNENISTKQFFRCDVASSFCREDEVLATKINQIIKGRVSTFLYSEKQKEIAGKNGEDEFNKVFGGEARLVVILYNFEWGTTSWTRIEETAIRNRSYSEGYDFTIFIMVKSNLQPPKWLPKNRIWFGLDRYGIEGAAAVIEARVQELYGEVRELTAGDKAKQKAREIEFEHTRQDFLRSQEGVKAARTEIANLFLEVRKIVDQIQSQNLKFKIDEDNHNLIVYSSGYTLSFYWSVTYSNSLDYSVLRLRVDKGSIPYKNREPFEDPERLIEESYYFDMLTPDQFGWRFRVRDGEFFTTDRLVNRGMEEFMDQIKASKTKK